jgi:hypothetical protein
MRKIIDIILIVGFLAVDVFFFHDIFKSSDMPSLAQYLTGILSIPVFVISLQSLFKK